MFLNRAIHKGTIWLYRRFQKLFNHNTKFGILILIDVGFITFQLVLPNSCTYNKNKSQHFTTDIYFIFINKCLFSNIVSYTVMDSTGM
jgi:hypothetical protein